MDEERNDVDMLPGFRFHPTDEELVGFYLRRKIQHRSLPIELIKQLDIYKFDPWDLPSKFNTLFPLLFSVRTLSVLTFVFFSFLARVEFASSGEKEWYFYCPRDRKYRNSARPNRVTGAGFWKATGTDRPIYSSEGSKCIGLKKSLVFYRGRAAKGIKTDWMMHEFRLPSLAEPGPPKKLLDKSYPANDAWAICRIFKKTNSMAQRALSQSWFSSLPETAPSSDHMLTNQPLHGPQFSSENISCTTDIGSAIQHNSTTSFFPPDHIPSYKPHNQKPCLYPVPNGDLPFMFSPLEMSGTAATMMLNQQFLMGDISISFDGSQEQFSGFSISSAKEMQGNAGTGEQQEDGLRNDPSAPHSQVNSQWKTTSTIGSIGFPFSLPWDSPPCPSEMSTNKCYS